MMDRKKTLAAIARHVTDADIVLPVYSTAFDWIDIRPNPLNYLSHGAMGLASSHALGLALGRPDKRVIVLDGDGSLLMNLGTLVTNAEVSRRRTCFTSSARTAPTRPTAAIRSRAAAR